MPYEDSSFSFLFSHHTVTHLLKVDIQRAIEEMKRVLMPGGLMFVNFPLIIPKELIDGREIGKGEFGWMHGIKDHIHSYFEDNEADIYFEGMEIVHKMKWEILKTQEEVDWFSMIEFIIHK